MISDNPGTGPPAAAVVNASRISFTSDGASNCRATKKNLRTKLFLRRNEWVKHEEFVVVVTHEGEVTEGEVGLAELRMKVKTAIDNKIADLREEFSGLHAPPEAEYHSSRR